MFVKSCILFSFSNKSKEIFYRVIYSIHVFVIHTLYYACCGIRNRTASGGGSDKYMGFGIEN